MFFKLSLYMTRDTVYSLPLKDPISLQLFKSPQKFLLLVIYILRKIYSSFSIYSARLNFWKKKVTIYYNAYDHIYFLFFIALSTCLILRNRNSFSTCVFILHCRSTYPSYFSGMRFQLSQNIWI